MFVPETFAMAMLMMVTSAVCWGSWANTYKLTKGYRFELFYWDYAVGIFLVSLLYALTLGTTGGAGAFRTASATSGRMSPGESQLRSPPAEAEGAEAASETTSALNVARTPIVRAPSSSPSSPEAALSEVAPSWVASPTAASS